MNSIDSHSVDSMLALSFLEGVGNRTLIKLVQVFGSAAQVLAANRPALLQCGLKKDALLQLDGFLRSPQDSPLGSKVRQAREQANQAEAEIFTLDMPTYPRLLAEIPDPPAILYVKGNADLLHLPQISIVGSRNASLGANQNAFNLARAISDAGFVVTSGFAQGIDQSAHEGALAANLGKGNTIAVLGTGVDRCYPVRNSPLMNKIAEQGVVVSELPMGTGPQRHHFPSRNRIISGLACGVLVIEAGLKSGSLITARMAMEQGREVFAIPGSIHHPLAKGCHQLIKQGAKLTENIDDILQELDSALQFHYAVFNQQSTQSLVSKDATAMSHKTVKPNPLKETTVSLPALVQKDLFSASQDLPLLALLGSDVVSVDGLVEATGCSPAVVMTQLFELEMQGLIESVSGGYRRSA